MSATAIRVEGLGKRYRIGERIRYKSLRESIMRGLTTRLSRSERAERQTIWALRDVSFDVQEGEIVGVIGRNGAGKSTLLKILSRITEPTLGRVELHGRVGSLLEVGTGFHQELTGRENIYLNGAILGMKKVEIERKFEEIVAFAEMEKFIDTPVKRFSSGMYMRLAFAVAAHLDPEILLVDEVLAVGDAAFQKKCLGKMGEVARSGRTVLFVSHNMNAVRQLCTRALLFVNGRLQHSDRDVQRLTREYLFESEDAGSAEWRNSGGEFEGLPFTPMRFAIVDEVGRPATQSRPNDADLNVIVEGNVRVLDPALNFGYAAYSESGDLLFWSLSTDTREDTWPMLRMGSLRLRSQLPKRFLNEGKYRLELIVSLHYRQWICRPGFNAPTIFLDIQGGLSDSPYWMARRPGLLAPVIPWSTW
jgi:lipopolysaccharide transport system ATP-binding protein